MEVFDVPQETEFSRNNTRKRKQIERLEVVPQLKKY